MKSSKYNKNWVRALAAWLCVVLVIGLVPVRAAENDGAAAEGEVKNVSETVAPEGEKTPEEEVKVPEKKKEAPKEEEKKAAPAEEAPKEEEKSPEEEKNAPQEEKKTSEEEEKAPD